LERGLVVELVGVEEAEEVAGLVRGDVADAVPDELRLGPPRGEGVLIQRVRVACGLAEEIEEDERGVLEAEVAGVDLRGEPDGLDPRLLDGPADDEAADAGRPEGVRVVAAVEEDE